MRIVTGLANVNVRTSPFSFSSMRTGFSSPSASPAGAGNASSATSRQSLSASAFALGIGGKANRPPPLTSETAAAMSRCACSIGTHGPPDCDHPGQFCTVSLRPTRRHSSPRNDIASFQLASMQCTCTGQMFVHGTVSPLISQCIMWMPLTPAFAISSISRVMPGLATLPPSQQYHISGPTIFSAAAAPRATGTKAAASRMRARWTGLADAREAFPPTIGFSDSFMTGEV